MKLASFMKWAITGKDDRKEESTRSVRDLWGIESEDTKRTGEVTIFPAVQKSISEDPTRELQYLNQLGALDDLARRFRVSKKEPFNKWLPPKVSVAWFDRNFTVLHIRKLVWMGDGMVADKWWGRAADVLGPNAKPITITEGGKASAGFIIDGDKGVGINIERLDNPHEGAYAKLNTTSELAWGVIDSKKLAEQFGSPVTNRTIWIVGFICLIMGILIRSAWH
jgi:hypothetical protein